MIVASVLFLCCHLKKMQIKGFAKKKKEKKKISYFLSFKFQDIKMTYLIKLLHYTVSLLAFGALILELFVLIANTYNKPFLKDMYFARLTKNETFIDFGLW
jgi:hypothetical protein